MLFYLLGASNINNPQKIDTKTISLWEKENIIKYLGSVEDVREIIANASCIVLPSYYKEGLPRSLLEAMAMGKPIITTNVSGCKECVEKPYLQKENLLVGKNGILVPPRNAIALKEAMEFLKNNNNLLSKMGKYSIKIAKTRFDINHTINTYKTNLKNTTRCDIQSAQVFKKIAFISNTCFGMYNFRLKVLQALKNEGYEIHIIAPYDNTSIKLKQEGFILHNIFIDSKSKNPIKDLKTIYQINKILNTLKPLMIFSYTIKCVIYGSFIANSLKIPNIAVITGLGYVFTNGGIFKRLLKIIVCKMYKISLKNTNKVWFLNNDDKEEFLNYNIISSDKAFILDSEGIDTKHFNPNFKQTKARDNNKIVFLLIARMLWDKGIGEFVEAAKMIQKIN
ncbi:glycosyltransferase [Helicobacter sp. MIT 14-3879]|uniref:glycosyltransferase n=1 Tax=Helicobacter sp. MIT 14-3879 TaxID=2040649 RepID=UPI000E1F8C21|nr:glycosyltransferase [Helicobacter sp. MIT 14-3879]RDU63159.1 hypothetical protein CQA44_05845 [Helicobacter sp. MIT 14-3879]